MLLGEGEAGLPKESVIVISQIFTVDKSRLDEYIGTLSPRRVQQICASLKLITEARDFFAPPADAHKPGDAPGAQEFQVK